MTELEKYICVLGTYNEITRMEGMQKYEKVLISNYDMFVYDQLQADPKNLLDMNYIAFIVSNIIDVDTKRIIELSRLIQVLFNDKTGKSFDELKEKICYEE